MIRGITGACLLVAMIAAAASAADSAPRSDPVIRGRGLFARQCSICHAARGFATNVLASRVGTEKSLISGRTDLQPAYVHFVVRNGLGAMPPLTKIELPDEDLSAIEAYLSRPADGSARGN